MRDLFNGTCDFCQRFRAHCARVRLRDNEQRMKLCGLSTACADCRRQLKGQYRLDARHVGRES